MVGFAVHPSITVVIVFDCGLSETKKYSVVIVTNLSIESNLWHTIHETTTEKTKTQRIILKKVREKSPQVMAFWEAIAFRDLYSRGVF